MFATPQQNLIFTYSGNALAYNRFGVKLQTFLNERLNISDEIALTYRSISFCNVDTDNKIKYNCTNYIKLCKKIGKYFICKKKYQKTIPNFRYYMKHKLNLGLIAEMKGKTDVHQKRWNNFTT